MKKIILWVVFIISLTMMLLTIFTSVENMLLIRTTLFLLCGVFLTASGLELNLFNLKSKVPLVSSESKGKHVFFWIITFLISFVVIMVSVRIQTFLGAFDAVENGVLMNEDKTTILNQATIVPFETTPVETTVEPQTCRQPADKKIDEEGIIYNINKTYNIGETTLEIERVKAKLHNYNKYYFIIEYRITNNTDKYVSWEFEHSNNHLGKLTADVQEWHLSEVHYDINDDISGRSTSGDSLSANEIFDGVLICDWHNPFDEAKHLIENEEIFLILGYKQEGNVKDEDYRELAIILNEKEEYSSNENAEREYFREALDRKIDTDGIIYNINKTFDMGSTMLEIASLKIESEMGLGYGGVLEYKITNKTDQPIKWKFCNEKSGNMIGTIVTGDREKEWLGGRSTFIDEKRNKPKLDGTLQSNEVVESYIAFGFEKEDLKENESMHFTMYYNQNGVDTEFSFILNAN